MLLTPKTKKAEAVAPRLQKITDLTLHKNHIVGAFNKGPTTQPRKSERIICFVNPIS